MSTPTDDNFASRAGQKLAHALTSFRIEPTGWICADLGANAGGFTDCLIRAGAAKVYAVERGYGVLDFRLRKDARVVVMERTDALRVHLPEPVRLVAIDTGWTRQSLILPVARSLLAPGGEMISLVKPHYEADAADLADGVLPDPLLERRSPRFARPFNRCDCNSSPKPKAPSAATAATENSYGAFGLSDPTRRRFLRPILPPHSKTIPAYPTESCIGSYPAAKSTSSLVVCSSKTPRRDPIALHAAIVAAIAPPPHALRFVAASFTASFSHIASMS